MREYTVIPREKWVEGTRPVLGKRKPFIGWIEGYNGTTYQVFVTEHQKIVDVLPEYVWSIGVDEQARKDAIDYAIDREDKDWFMELTGGEASGTDEKLLRPSNGD